MNRLFGERGLLVFRSTAGLLLMLYSNIGGVLSLKCDFTPTSLVLHNLVDQGIKKIILVYKLSG